MSKINIWDNFSFTVRKGKSVLSYLDEQQKYLASTTKGILHLDTTTFTTSENEMAFRVHVRAESLGNYGVEILTIIEKNPDEYFPVNIMSPYKDEVIKAEEKDFLNEIESFLLSSKIKRKIESLYQQAKENK